MRDIDKRTFEVLRPAFGKCSATDPIARATSSGNTPTAAENAPTFCVHSPHRRSKLLTTLQTRCSTPYRTPDSDSSFLKVSPNDERQARRLVPVSPHHGDRRSVVLAAVSRRRRVVGLRASGRRGGARGRGAFHSVRLRDRVRAALCRGGRGAARALLHGRRDGPASDRRPLFRHDRKATDEGVSQVRHLQRHAGREVRRRGSVAVAAQRLGEARRHADPGVSGRSTCRRPRRRLLSRAPDTWYGSIALVPAEHVQPIALSFNDAIEICERLGRESAAQLQPFVAGTAGRADSVGTSSADGAASVCPCVAAHGKGSDVTRRRLASCGPTR